MNILVSGQHIKIESNLKEYITDSVKASIHKYFPQVEEALNVEVHLMDAGKNGDVTCDIVINTGLRRHKRICGNATCDDTYSVFDIALSRMIKQLRKYKDRLNNNHKEKISEIDVNMAELDAIKYTINSNFTTKTSQQEESHPTIIAEKSTQISSLSVAEAVMRMDLENLPALMFKNINTGRMNIVYYRKDGNISWVDSK